MPISKVPTLRTDVVLGALLQQQYPDALAAWDGWNYKVFGPLSFDDEAAVRVHLKNKKGHEVVLTVLLTGAEVMNREEERNGVVDRRGEGSAQAKGPLR